MILNILLQSTVT
uniref:Uncharacterized protein n=1 Tax=Anguilla anguilla TaxID=7936 RepID=A0A0E9T7R2_ANGAN